VECCALAQLALDQESFPVLWHGTLLCEGSSGDFPRGAQARASVRALHLDGDDIEVMLHVVCVCVCVCVRARARMIHTENKLSLVLSSRSLSLTHTGDVGS
jgi:hypothetical protein